MERSPSVAARNVNDAEQVVFNPQSNELDSGWLESESDDSHEIILRPTSSTAVTSNRKGSFRSGLDGLAAEDEMRGAASYGEDVGYSDG